MLPAPLPHGVMLGLSNSLVWDMWEVITSTLDDSKRLLGILDLDPGLLQFTFGRIKIGSQSDMTHEPTGEEFPFG